MCDLEQVRHTDKFDWTLWHGDTPSGLTGPCAAFTGDFYIYIEATGSRRGHDAMYGFSNGY